MQATVERQSLDVAKAYCMNHLGDTGYAWVGKLLYGPPGEWARRMSFRLSGECPGPHESTAVRLIRPDDLLGHLGVQDRPYVSTTVVSTALAAGSLYPVTADLPLPRRGVGSGLPTPEDEVRDRRDSGGADQCHDW